MTFRVGQKVVCIREFRDTRCPLTKHWPKLNVVYTIREIRVSRSDGELYFHLNELVNPVGNFSQGRGEAYFYSRNFRPVVERKTDISIFTEMLAPQRELALTTGEKTP